MVADTEVDDVSISSVLACTFTVSDAAPTSSFTLMLDVLPGVRTILSTLNVLNPESDTVAS